MGEEASADRSESVRMSTAAGQQAVVDASVFTSWLTARQEGNSAPASLIEARFRDEFAVAFQDWLSIDPLNNPDAASTPLALSSYRLASVEQAAALEASATARFADALRANQRSDNHVFMTVMLAGVLFLSALSMRLGTPKPQLTVLAVSVIAFVAICAVVATLPVEV